jgi:hypothetical protein
VQYQCRWDFSPAGVGLFVTVVNALKREGQSWTEGPSPGGGAEADTQGPAGRARPEREDTSTGLRRAASCDEKYDQHFPAIILRRTASHRARKRRPWRQNEQFRGQNEPDRILKLLIIARQFSARDVAST